MYVCLSGGYNMLMLLVNIENYLIFVKYTDREFTKNLPNFYLASIGFYCKETLGEKKL